MRCICCLSNRITDRPLGLDGKHYCLDCGLIFDVRAERDGIRKSEKYHYQNVDPHSEVGESKEYLFNLALNYLSSEIKGEGNSILDVGCGFGYFLELALGKGWRVSGVEVVSNAVREAKAKVGKQNIFHGTLESARYPDNSFDAITLWDILFEVQNPFKELNECFRVLKERGIIGIRVRNVVFEKIAFNTYSVLKNRVPSLGVKPPYVFHRYCFSSNSISQLLHRVGFTQIRITNSPLTKGDPYGYTDIKILVKAAKGLFDLTSRLAFSISGGKWLIGPSLLIWAEKP